MNNMKGNPKICFFLFMINLKQRHKVIKEYNIMFKDELFYAFSCLKCFLLKFKINYYFYTLETNVLMNNFLIPNMQSISLP